MSTSMSHACLYAQSPNLVQMNTRRKAGWPLLQLLVCRKIGNTGTGTVTLSGLIDAAGFPSVDRPLHTWQHLQQETNRCSRGNACRQSQWGRLAEEKRTPTVLSEGPCFLERNKPPSHSQQENRQQPISRFGISCCTSRSLGRMVSQCPASVRSTRGKSGGLKGRRNTQLKPTSS